MTTVRGEADFVFVPRVWERRVLVVATAIAVAVPIVHAIATGGAMNHDVAMYLRAGDLLLEGQVPYVDFIELNPPLIMYLSAVPAGIARLAGVSPIAVGLGSVGVLGLASVGALWGLLRRRGLPDNLHLLLPFAVALTSATAALFGEFGQREHLFFLVAAPFVVLRLIGGVGCRRLPSVAIGAAAGIGACLKPWFALVIVVPEALAVIHSRELRSRLTADAIAVVAAPIVYLSHFLFVPRAMRDAYFGEYLPLVNAAYDETFGIPFGEFVSMTRNGIRAFLGGLPAPSVVAMPPWAALIAPALIALCAGYLASRRHRESDAAVLTLGLSLSSIAGFVIFILQRKGWEYHAIPFRGFALMSLVALPSLVPQRVRTVSRYTNVAIPAVCLTVALLAMAQARRPEPVSTRQQALEAIVRTYSDAGDQVLMLTESVVPAFPVLVALDRDLGSRYMWLFPVPLFRYMGDADGEQTLTARLVEDIDTRAPELIVLDRDHCETCAGHVSMEEFLDESPELSAALSNYRVRSTSAHWIVYTPAST